MIKNKKQLVHLQHSSSLLLLMIMMTPLFTTTLAQSPTNITAILEKAGRFSIMIRLLKSTKLGDQLNSQLNKSFQLTFFAPPDKAFSSLPSGTLNSFTDQQKLALVQFHVLPTYVSILQFQTLTNPVQTQAGDSYNSQFPLNVTTNGISVNMTTGVVKASVVSTIYTDGQLAVYQVDHVLLPLQFYFSLSPALAPAPSELKKSHSSDALSSSSTDAPVRITRFIGVSFAVAVIAVIPAIAL
ncbi:fasciclin-like arabinogalactan protein 11 isoform X2 [Telopea speciosissima]|uniref:fasciclin-like arabinogalactan protein 11 isoform X1 n=1 Tax=Telopea speciosissima TaxID=54955 RepID=UPI001CC3667E|nr:fasciclin-like arabinogalactan protein 11 isoform X1 [Telopea speciosissima]XP_043702654.1 fasciclin-like arabinogalactan protein 11 isoform X2 [Telopea speciosissima]